MSIHKIEKDLELLDINDLHEIYRFVTEYNIKYLSGVTKISIFENKILDKKFTLLYDVHSYKGVCRKQNISNYIDVSEWLKNIAETENRPLLDFYIEYRVLSLKFSSKAQNNKNIKNYKNHIIDIDENYGDISIVLRDFEPCLNLEDLISVNKSPCPYNNVRIHWIDIRKYSELQNIMYRLRVSGRLNNEQINTVINLINNPFEYYNNLLKIAKIQKQANNINPDLLLKINEFFNNYINRLKYDYQKSKKTRLDTFMYVLYFYNLDMDIYGIYRMFRTFNDSKIKNVIVYAGGYHCRLYEELLEFLKFDNLYTSGGFEVSKTNDFIDITIGNNIISKQCVDINNLYELNNLILADT